MNTRPRGLVLLDAPNCDKVAFDVSFLERNEHPVVLCPGPKPGQLCPLLGEGACSKYEAAHGVVFELDLDRPQHRAIVERYRALNPDIPIRVVVRSGQADQYRAALADVQLWTREPTVAELDGFAAEVEAADRYLPPTPAEETREGARR